MAINIHIGQRGKGTENLFSKLMTQVNRKVMRFAWHRYPDARAARGKLAAQPCDYILVSEGKTFHVEVKETKHDYRLARDAFSQLPTLYKFFVAGLPFEVVVHHLESGLWRVIPTSFFADLDWGALPASWNLSGLPAHASLEAALIQESMWYPVKEYLNDPPLGMRTWEANK